MYIYDTNGVIGWIASAIWNGALIYIGIKVEQHYLAPRRAKAEKDKEWWKPKDPT